MNEQAAASQIGSTSEQKGMLWAWPPSAIDSVEKALHTVRSHLGMDVGFVSEFIGDQRVFRHVDTKSQRSPIRAGETSSLDTGYCRSIVEGRLPELIPDTSMLREAMAIPDTLAMPIGAHLSVPLRLADGQVYGTFCCFSFEADASLNQRDLNFMHAFAELISHQVEADLHRSRDLSKKTERIEAALRSREPSIVYQPVIQLADSTLLGAEALARFGAEPTRSPDKWFAEASEASLKIELELQAIRNAVAGYRRVWARGPFSIALNASPQTIVDGRLQTSLAGFPAERICIEITEHDHVENYGVLLQALAPLRALGAKIAVDDAGSGYASMRHILILRPDAIKLDISLTRHIDTDPMKQALARALIGFGRQFDCTIVAECVETAPELAALRRIGAHAAQGFHLGQPMPIDDFCRLLP